ncbi:pseudouridine-5'-phosphate glycosidase-like [Salvia hispanica]|uniref:pseudouridine-5'-phosphate glycosidase-like n=1 Tax=Salvia hispanica TaxID=49212 RepID=UPI00200938DE|nr:pseudouridine-5'-phosphate glycosidase-like [Salvia hispanica]
MSLSLRSITGNVPVKFSDEVSEALKHNKPVVALESAIVSEGARFPHNLHEVNKVLEVIRSNGAVPGMIAILDGAA